MQKKKVKLIVNCPKCLQENRAPHHDNNRIDYAKRYGDFFALTCKSCNKLTEFHVDDIKAVDYSVGEIIKNRLIIFSVIFVFTFIIGFFIVGIIAGVIFSLISTLISITFAKKNNASENRIFNKYKLKRRISEIGFRI